MKMTLIMMVSISFLTSIFAAGRDEKPGAPK
ncbi:hypothetical protein JOD44_001973 [Salimicrobium jeotgali]|uniref:Uncharacterized protein n=2 Tax=Salimicrobium TaxID=351195 RepID=A0ABY1KK24_9BACI|nr:hypothetical protein [Salimicrobium jeotgali]SDX48606.1 hypothetical protein SAMN04488081_0680 [Salimicrobium album]SIS44143.1 hypothetical protein SAMN05421758_10124 [Salimicrobium salexigens]